MRTFKEPIYVTRPLMPDINSISRKMEEIFKEKILTNVGPQHILLEQSLKKYLSVKNISLFNNGTSALLLGLKSLELKGEVITTPFTFPATVQALDWNGLTPIFCDIDPDSLNIDPAKIEKMITKNTSAILAVHVFGNPCDVEAIRKIAEKHNLKVIYDAAHAFGSKIGGEPIGNFGDMVMFSFHATKLFNTVEGGGLTYKDDKLIKKLDLLKNFGLDGPEKVVLSGLNAKMNEIQAGIGLEVLDLVDQERLKRDKIKKVYEKSLENVPGIRVLTQLEKESSSYQYFVIEIDESSYGRSRDWIHEELKRYNIYTRKYFSPLCSEFYWYKHLESAQCDHLPCANRVVKSVLCLPYYGDLALEAVETICTLIEENACQTVF